MTIIPCKKIINRLKKCFSFDHGKHCSVVVWLLIMILLSLFNSEYLFARDSVIVLNSDMSIENYSLAHTEFKSMMVDLKDEIDLGSKWVNEKSIKKRIKKIDPDVIYCIGSKAYQMAYKFAKKKNLVFSLAINWRRLPMGKNTYGISNELHQGMQLMMHRYLFPDVNKIGVLYSKIYSEEWLNIAIENAKEVGIDIIGRHISESDDIESALDELLPEVDALWLTPDPIVISNVESVVKIFEQCEAVRKPVFAYNRTFANFGATLIMSADISTMGRQAAGIALDILANKKVIERVQNPAGSHIVLNLKKVDEYGINLNIEALESVNEIIR
ncbi:MAG: ABC transporter substrate-binding protein [Candidatus Scalinduaceae bacterium]